MKLRLHHCIKIFAAVLGTGTGASGGKGVGGGDIFEKPFCVCSHLTRGGSGHHAHSCVELKAARPHWHLPLSQELLGWCVVSTT